MDAAAAERAPLLGVVDDVAHAAPSSARRDSRTVAPRWVERRVERPTATARLLGRAGGVLGQSPGKWNIEHKWGEKSSCCTWMDRAETVWDTGRRMLYRTDLFHTVVNLSTWKILAIVTMVYIVIFATFGGMYWVMAKWPAAFGNCGLVHQNGDGTNTHTKMTFWDALFFSVETQATIGYSAPSDIFFDDCPLILVAITFQSVIGLFLNAALLGLLFNRIARVATGNVAYYQPFPMRLQRPDDELGGMLLLNLPNIVVHTLDNWSPLVPHPMDLRLWRAPSSSPRDHPESDDDGGDDDWSTDDEEAYGGEDKYVLSGRGKSRKQRHDPMSQCRFPDVLQRASDCETGNRDSVMCATCGETFPHARALRKHMRYNCIGDKISGWEMSLMCSVCGDAFVSHTALQLHIRASPSCTEAGTAAAEVESDDDANMLTAAQDVIRDDESARYRRNRHRDVIRPGQGAVAAAAPGLSAVDSESGVDEEHEPWRSRELIEKWMENTQAEIIVLVEGIDATTSYTVQARHSYTWQELAWDCTFAQTVFPSERLPVSDLGTGTGAGTGQTTQQGCMIDFTKFNDLVPVRSDGETSPRDLDPLPSPRQRYGQIIQ